MKPHKHCELIKAWADGAEVEYLHGGREWMKLDSPRWDSAGEYRLRDPYRELKEAAADPTKQVRWRGGGRDWEDVGATWEWSSPPEDYEIRDKPVEKRKVKLLAWITHSSLEWRTVGSPAHVDWKRVPSEDKEVEV